MTSIERAARALHDHPSFLGDPEEAFEMARAVIAAIREPSEAMLAAGEDQEAQSARGTAQNMWRAMIDALLEDGDEIDPRHAARPTDGAMQPGVEMPGIPISWGMEHRMYPSKRD